MADQDGKYEVNLFFDKGGNLEKGHVKAICNHSGELLNTINAVKEAYPTITVASVAPATNSTDKFCSIHGVGLEWGKGKNPPHKPYLYHKLEDGKYCFGK